MLSGARSLYANWQWGGVQPPAVVRALELARERTPSVSTLQLVFRELDFEAFDAAPARLAHGQMGDWWEEVALEGKALRGIHGDEAPGVQLVDVYGDRVGLVLAARWNVVLG